MDEQDFINQQSEKIYEFSPIPGLKLLLEGRLSDMLRSRSINNQSTQIRFSFYPVSKEKFEQIIWVIANNRGDHYKGARILNMNISMFADSPFQHVSQLSIEAALDLLVSWYNVIFNSDRDDYLTRLQRMLVEYESYTKFMESLLSFADYVFDASYNNRQRLALHIIFNMDRVVSDSDVFSGLIGEEHNAQSDDDDENNFSSQLEELEKQVNDILDEDHVLYWANNVDNLQTAIAINDYLNGITATSNISNLNITNNNSENNNDNNIFEENEPNNEEIQFAIQNQRYLEELLQLSNYLEDLNREESLLELNENVARGYTNNELITNPEQQPRNDDDEFRSGGGVRATKRKLAGERNNIKETTSSWRKSTGLIVKQRRLRSNTLRSDMGTICDKSRKCIERIYTRNGGRLLRRKNPSASF